MKAGGKVVGAAVGQVAQQRALRQRHQAGDRFVQSAVAAGADHRIVVGAPLRRHAAGVAAGLRDKDPHQIAGAGKSGYRIEQGALDLVLPARGLTMNRSFFMALLLLCTVDTAHGGSRARDALPSVDKGLPCQVMVSLCHSVGGIATGSAAAMTGKRARCRLAEKSCKTGGFRL